MANIGPMIKTAAKVLTTSVAILSALKENPQVGEKAGEALEKVRSAANSRSPKQRFEAKLAAIETCADAVGTEFGQPAEAEKWRREAAALRVRADLVWNAGSGKQRRRDMKSINDRTTALLQKMNERLASLTAHDDRAEELNPA